MLCQFAMQNSIPINMVLDPSSPPPPSELCEYSNILLRDKAFLTPLDVGEIVEQLNAAAPIGVNVLAPTSEYLMEVATSVDKSFYGGLIEIPYQSIFQYKTLSSKIFLNELSKFGFKGNIASQVIAGTSLPFVAKPKFNIVDNRTLKPFIVDDEDSLSEFQSVKQNYYAQNFVSGPSIYWCSYTKETGETFSYFQENLFQEGNGGSVAQAKVIVANNSELSELSQVMTDFLVKIEYRGPLMAEFRGKELSLIEINPRFWGPLLLDATNRGVIISSFFEDFFHTQVRIPNVFGSSTEYLVPKLLEKSVSIDNVFMKVKVDDGYQKGNVDPSLISKLIAIGGDWL